MKATTRAEPGAEPNPTRRADPVAPSKTPGTDNRSWRLLAVVLGGQFMAPLDVFIVNVAAPDIRRDLSASGAELQLVIAGYSLTYAVLLITGARLGGRYGYRPVYLFGLAVFTLSSLACGLSAHTADLIAFRLVQGAGAALLVPQVLSMIQRHFTGAARTRALGVYTAVLAGAATVGQVLGGILVSADLAGTGWRPVFLVNVPLGAVLLVCGWRVLPREDARATAPGAARRLDLPGLVLLGAAVSLLTLPLVLGQQQHWPPWSWLSLGAAVLVFALFCGYESRLARRGGAPIVSPRVVRIPGMGTAVVRIGVAMAINGGFLFAFTLHLQSGLGFGALRAGLTFVPYALAFGLVGTAWRRFPASWRRVMVPGGFALTAVSTAALGFLLRDGGGVGVAGLLADAAAGAGLALAFSPVLAGALATVRAEEAADASGLLATVPQLGSVIGVAVFGTLFLNRLTTHASPHPHASADALLMCMIALAAAGTLGAVSGPVFRRR